MKRERRTGGAWNASNLPHGLCENGAAFIDVSNDSGAAHVAAALGRTTVVIFGSTDPRWTAPRGEHVRALWDRVRCAPCFRTHCPYEDAYACLRIVESRDVIEALQ